MGGRLATGAQGGGVISPYPFSSPPPPLLHPQMGQMNQNHNLGLMPSGAAAAPMTKSPVAGAAGAAAAAGSYEKAHHRRISSMSSGQYTSFYAPTRTSHETQGGGGQQPPLSPAATTASSGSNGQYNPLGRGPSPGPSIQGPVSVSVSEYSSGGGKSSSKEKEEMSGMMKRQSFGGGMMMPHVVNPDEYGREQYQQHQQHLSPGQMFYHQQGAASSGPPTAVPTLPPGAGLPTSLKHPTNAPIVLYPPQPEEPVVHQDAGRVDQATENEIPPAYDSLPPDVRR